ncbi:IclR family transcriptional regulator [Dethiosulfovibrio salsuginis]|uniref:Transcriptional regulator, IclR family n=1 Tax=Dethiosulfovibrio salsuginis TaxID=561720 RepID=A0A1X7IYD5_9BACT|nr:IclR family transcriptional regulator [Dethiosulfovibrio salsuginis]SMG20162.1 transcriptional regulator, IclR family [Dethiosulfovibrio salsuginis]
MNDPKERLDAVGKVVQIMDLLCTSDETLTIREIETRSGIPRSTVHRFLTSLEQQEWVYRDTHSDSYRPGIRFFLLHNLGTFYQELTEIADPIMNELVKTTGKTAIMSVLEGTTGLCIHTVEPLLSMKFVAHKGMTIPLHTGATGKVLLAFCKDRTRDRILSSMTDQGRASSLRHQIETIRAQGYAVSKEEWIEHAGDISVPVFDSKGFFVAQLGIAGLASSFDDHEEELLKLVRDGASKIAKSL